MISKFSVSRYLSSHTELASKLSVDDLEKGVELVAAAYFDGRKILTCGNGGSASTASHYITDWNKMVHLNTGRKFRGVCLSDNVGLLTAYANDISYDDVFSGQIEALMDEGDLLVALSVSGNSPNVVKAIDATRRAGGSVLGLVGYDGGQVLSLCDHCIWVPSLDMQLCEDVLLMFGHMVMKRLCGLGINGITS